MARKNRYEYALLKQTRELLMETSFRDEQHKHKAQLLMNKISTFLTEEKINLVKVDERRARRMTASQGWSPTDWVIERLNTPVTDAVPCEREEVQVITTPSSNGTQSNGVTFNTWYTLNNTSGGTSGQ